MLIGITLTKKTLFRGVDQEFHNTYYYSLPTAVTAPSAALVAEMVNDEKDLHSINVQYVRAKVWTAGGTKAQNQMIHQANLSGTGLQSAIPGMDKERAVLVRWPAGFDVRGLPVYLRKWYHSCGNCAAVDLSTPAILANTQELTTGQRSQIATAAQKLANVGSGEFWDLVAASGRERTGPAEGHRYLEHHQLGDMWR